MTSAKNAGRKRAPRATRYVRTYQAPNKAGSEFVAPQPGDANSQWETSPGLTMVRRGHHQSVRCVACNGSAHMYRTHHNICKHMSMMPLRRFCRCCATKRPGAASDVPRFTSQQEDMRAPLRVCGGTYRPSQEAFARLLRHLSAERMCCCARRLFSSAGAPGSATGASKHHSMSSSSLGAAARVRSTEHPGWR